MEEERKLDSFMKFMYVIRFRWPDDSENQGRAGRRITVSGKSRDSILPVHRCEFQEIPTSQRVAFLLLHLPVCKAPLRAS